MCFEHRRRRMLELTGQLHPYSTHRWGLIPKRRCSAYVGSTSYPHLLWYQSGQQFHYERQKSRRFAPNHPCTMCHYGVVSWLQLITVSNSGHSHIGIQSLDLGWRPEPPDVHPSLEERICISGPWTMAKPCHSRLNQS